MRRSAPLSAASEPTPLTVQQPAAEPLVIAFPAGLPGFEKCRRFVLVRAPEIAPLMWLRSLDPPAPSFLTVDPGLVDPAYDRTLGPFERARLGGGQQAPLWLAIVNLSAEGATINLRAPIVVDPERMIGYQIVRDDDRHSIHFSLTAG